MYISLFSLYTDKKLGSTVLFFGCRHLSQDYIYQEELEDYHSKGVLTGLHVAFSRDQVESCDSHVIMSYIIIIIIGTKGICTG